MGAGVTGWVRNLRDGRVEAELEGADAAVAAVLDWMGTGPRGGRVTSVEQDDVTPTGDAGFEIRRDDGRDLDVGMARHFVDPSKPFADEVISIPVAPPLLSPLLAIVPLQVFACELATAKGLDVDQPRNLA